jgi:hypothetical protein
MAPVPRHLSRRCVAPAVAFALAALVLSGCSVLFVPRKPDVTPSPTPNTAVHEFPALEARLPDNIDGKPVQKFSLISDPSLQVPKTLEVLRRLNKTPNDVQLANGFVTGADVTLSAMRIIGSDAVKAAVAFEQVDEGDPSTTTTYAPAVVAGKRVLVRTSGDTVSYLYPLDDVIFVVGGTRALVEEALAAIH